jgi:Tol biopolymer transport system component/energy-coupling factor transporter ATP-binding protein EcfA2
VTSAIPSPSAAIPSIQVHGDVEGSIVFGDNNFVVNQNHGTIVYQAPRPRVSRHALSPPRPRPPLLFLDRSGEVQQASGLLEDYQPVVVFGIEGIGKTTLLKQLANLLPAEKFPDGTVLVDGEWEQLAAGRLDDVVQSVFEALYESDPPLKVTISTARTYLGSVKALILLDHLALSPRTWAQLPDLFPAAGLLWTVPYQPPGRAGWELRLAGLPAEASTRLFLQTLGLDPGKTAPRILHQICEQLDHLPLAIVTLARWVRARQVPLPRVLEMLTAQSGAGQNAVDLALETVVSSLGGVERDLFSLVASAGGTTVDRGVLIKASGLENSLAESSLDNLEAIGLLQAHSPDMGMHPAHKAFVRQRWPASEDQISRMARAILDYVDARRGSLEVLRAQLGNLSGILDYGLQSGRLDLAETAAILAAPQLVLAGKWDLWGDIFTRIIPAAERGGNYALLGRAYHELGTHRLAMGDRPEAIRLLTQARDIRLRLGDRIGAAYSQHNLNRLLGPPPPGQPPGPKTGPSWSPVIVGALLGGLGLLSLLAVGLVLAWIYLSSNGNPPPVVTSSPIIIAAVTDTDIPLPPELTATPAPTYTYTPIFTSTPTNTAAPTATTTHTPTHTPSATPTQTPTPTLTPTPTFTPTFTPTDTPTASPQPFGNIIFASDRDGDREIYRMRADGGGVTRLTTVSGDDNRPDWSPDGDIAYDSVRDGSWGIYVGYGSNPRKLSGSPGVNEFNPDWSPDGNSIAYETNRDGNFEIYIEAVVKFDDVGDNGRNLTNNPADDGCPDWSPDGRRIAFSSDRDANREIYVMNNDGSGQTRLTNNPALDNCPTWSPDGRTLAFRSDRDGDAEMWLMDADGSNQRQLTRNSVPDWAPAAWSPDGHWLAFLSNRAGNWEIYIISVDGITEINLTNRPSYDAYPAWTGSLNIVD